MHQNLYLITPETMKLRSIQTLWSKKETYDLDTKPEEEEDRWSSALEWSERFLIERGDRLVVEEKTQTACCLVLRNEETRRFPLLETPRGLYPVFMQRRAIYTTADSGHDALLKIILIKQWIQYVNVCNLISNNSIWFYFSFLTIAFDCIISVVSRYL